MTTKKCCKCSEQKPVSLFGRHSRAKDGLQYACRTCVNAANAELERANKQTYAEKKRANAIKNAAALKARKADHYQKNRDKYLAMMKVRRDTLKAITPKKPIVRIAKGKDPIKRKEALARYQAKHAVQIVARARAWNNSRPEVGRVHLAKRRAKKKNATVQWANEFFIKEIYRLADLRTNVTGIKWEVDHIVPLQSDLVCGLHCEQNLQVIPRFENLRKSNLFWPDMPSGNRVFRP